MQQGTARQRGGRNPVTGAGDICVGFAEPAASSRRARWREHLIVEAAVRIEGASQHWRSNGAVKYIKAQEVTA